MCAYWRREGEVNLGKRGTESALIARGRGEGKGKYEPAREQGGGGGQDLLL